jgi:23S rRNA (adenine2503-C2)-methyltransferase
MTNLSKRDQDTLRQRLTFATSTVTTHQASSDGTQKLLLTWPDEGSSAGGVAECVMIPDGDRRTACISSQVGCPVGL